MKLLLVVDILLAVGMSSVGYSESFDLQHSVGLLLVAVVLVAYL